MRDEDGGCITSGALEEARDAAGLYHLACRNARDTLRTMRGGVVPWLADYLPAFAERSGEMAGQMRAALAEAR